MSKADPLWIVVHVTSGIPSSVEVFLDYQEARDYETKLRGQINLDHDETAIFEYSVKERLEANAHE